jgi:DNA-binding transcriptional regulator YbjK
MPPFNTARRERLADAAIEVIAQEGSRGLTHRAVDAEAGEPAGTTSRYYRTRDALLRATVERIRTLHFADLERAPRGPVDAGVIAGHLADVVYDAITVNRSRHLAMCELFLESTRRPDLRAALTDSRTAQIKLVRDIHLAAGLELRDDAATTLVSTFTGLLFITITTPEAVGVHSPEDARDLARRAVLDAHG